jgi:hypothetical protein
MIGQKVDASDIQITQDLSAYSIFAVILPLAFWCRAAILVGMELKSVCAVDVSDYEAVRVLIKVDYNSGTFLRDSS